MSETMKYKKPALSVEERAEDLLSRMTLREKIAQLDMKFGSKYCTEPDPNDNCSAAETTDYYWDKLREDFPDGLGYLQAAEDEQLAPTLFDIVDTELENRGA